MNALYRPIALLSVVSLIMASTLTGSSVSADTNDSGHEPQGQLTRRGLTGSVAGVGGSSFVLETKFGNVTIDVDGGTIVKSGGEIVDFDVLAVGDRAAVLLDRPPDAPGGKGSGGGDGGPDLEAPSTGDDTGTEPDPTATPTVTPTPELAPPPTGDDTGTDPDVTPTPTPTPELTPPPTGDDTGTDPDVTPTPTPTPTVDLTSPNTTDDTGTDPDMTPPSTGDDTGTEPDPTVTPVPTPAPSFRQGVTALRITIVPSKASRSHKRGVVTSKGQGKIRFLDENGEEQELDGEDDAGEGDDVVFITRGKRGGRSIVTGSTDPGDVDARLAKLAESNPELAARITAKKAANQAKRDERLANTLGNAPDDKKGGVRGAIERSKNRGPGDNQGSGRGNSGGSNSGSVNSSGRNSDGGISGGGNSGRGSSDSGGRGRG